MQKSGIRDPDGCWQGRRLGRLSQCLPPKPGMVRHPCRAGRGTGHQASSLKPQAGGIPESGIQPCAHPPLLSSTCPLFPQPVQLRRPPRPLFSGFHFVICTSYFVLALRHLSHPADCRRQDVDATRGHRALSRRDTCSDAARYLRAASLSISFDKAGAFP